MPYTSGLGRNVSLLRNGHNCMQYSMLRNYSYVLNRLGLVEEPKISEVIS